MNYYAKVLAADDSVRVEFKLLDYTNLDGLKASGKTCSRSGCDVLMKGYVDTLKPLNSWPGSNSDPKTWAKIFDQTTNKAKVNKIVSRDVCSGSYNKANLRVEVEDKNRIMSNEEIQEFECMSGRNVQSSESSAQWSDPVDCAGKFNPTKVKMTYSWRAFRVPVSQCGKPVAG